MNPVFEVTGFNTGVKKPGELKEAGNDAWEDIK